LLWSRPWPHNTKQILDNTANPATIHHVGVYIGAGNMIDAPPSRRRWPFYQR
jgi:cell wall-associated NlpC family hydrolase